MSAPAHAVQAATGLSAIHDLHENDLFIAGFAKSGNTWFQNLVSGVIFGVRPELAPDTLVQELVPDVDYKRWYKRFQTPMFFKTHHLPRPEYRRVVYLVRDGRDVMVSWAHHAAAIWGRPYSDEDLIGFIREGHPAFARWQDHVEAWAANPYGAALLTVRYEDLKADPVRELLRFCAFVGVERSPSYLTAVAEGASFEKMRQKEVRSGWDNPAWPKDKLFVRRGVVGSHMDELPPHVLEALLAGAAGTLRRCGYAVERPNPAKDSKDSSAAA
jgi:hypothetical protein